MRVAICVILSAVVAIAAAVEFPHGEPEPEHLMVSKAEARVRLEAAKAAGFDPEAAVERLRTRSAAGENHYHNASEVNNLLLYYTVDAPCADYTALFNPGAPTDGGGLIYILKFGETPTTNIYMNEDVLFLATERGTEPFGKELLLDFIEYLCTGVSSSSSSTVLTDLLDEKELIFVPVLNPDAVGYEGNGQGDATADNLNGVDLTEAWPIIDDIESSTTDFEEEINVGIDVSYSWWFASALNLRGSDYTMMYPYTSYDSDPSDVDTFTDLANEYTSNVGGAAMNTVRGFSLGQNLRSFIDYMWDFHQTVSLTVFTNTVPPDSSATGSELIAGFNDHRDAIQAFASFNTGIEGFIINDNLGTTWPGNIKIEGLYEDDDTIITTGAGSFYHYLSPGTYQVTANANNAAKKVTTSVTVTAGEMTRQDFALNIQTTFFENIDSSVQPDNLNGAETAGIVIGVFGFVVILAAAAGAFYYYKTEAYHYRDNLEDRPETGEGNYVDAQDAGLVDEGADDPVEEPEAAPEAKAEPAAAEPTVEEDQV